MGFAINIAINTNNAIATTLAACLLMAERPWVGTYFAEGLHVPLSTLNQKIKRLDIKIRKKGE